MLIFRCRELCPRFSQARKFLRVYTANQAGLDNQLWYAAEQVALYFSVVQNPD